ncbi:MAG: shikimate kinase [Pseudomonadota bacterium]
MPDKTTNEAKAPNRRRLSRTVALVGLMGAGKTVIGKRVAAALGATFRDSDAEIEAAAAMTIPEIFASHGEAYFRAGERRVIARLLTESPHVLATGGGAFMDPDTRSIMLEKAITVWLKADLDTLTRRCSRKSNRPLLKKGDPRAILSRLIDERYPVYAEARLVVHSGEEPHEVTVARVLEAVADAGGLEANDVASSRETTNP